VNLVRYKNTIEMIIMLRINLITYLKRIKQVEKLEK